MKKIYVCSPYSGNIEFHTRYAREASRTIFDEGHIPIAPHLLFPQFMSEETERDKALQMGIEILKLCDELWIFGKVISPGMEKEINEAHKLNIRIRKGIDMTDFINTFGFRF